MLSSTLIHEYPGKQTFGIMKTGGNSVECNSLTKNKTKSVEEQIAEALSNSTRRDLEADAEDLENAEVCSIMTNMTAMTAMSDVSLSPPVSNSRDAKSVIRQHQETAFKNTGSSSPSKSSKESKKKLGCISESRESDYQTPEATPKQSRSNELIEKESPSRKEIIVGKNQPKNTSASSPLDLKKGHKRSGSDTTLNGSRVRERSSSRSRSNSRSRSGVLSSHSARSLDDFKFNPLDSEFQKEGAKPFSEKKSIDDKKEETEDEEDIESNAKEDEKDESFLGYCIIRFAKIFNAEPTPSLVKFIEFLIMLGMMSFGAVMFCFIAGYLISI